MAHNRSRAPLNWFLQGQRCGRCKVRRRAERVSRPAREKKRRLRTLVVAPLAQTEACGPVYQVVGDDLRCHQTALAAKRPEGR